jgi:hypothetical protein
MGESEGRSGKKGLVLKMTQKTLYKNELRYPLLRILLRGSFFVLFMPLFFSAPVLWGQAPEYRIEDDGRFVQILTWGEQRSILYYKIEIEKQVGEAWEEAVAEETEQTFFEVVLVSGLYRYRVTSYDLLGKPGPAADWIQFEVLPAKQPELLRFSPEAFYLDEDISWSVNLFGRNLADGIEIFLRGPRGNLIKPEVITVEQSGDRVQLVFGFGQLDTGSYTVHAVNPGGLMDDLEGFRIAFRKPVDISVSAGYRPLIPLYGMINELFQTGFFPIGAYGRLSVIPFKRRWGYMGFELEPSWHYLMVTQEDYKVQGNMLGGTVFGVFQRWFSNRVTALNFRIGGGIYSIPDYRFIFTRGETEPVMILIPAVAAGISFQWHVKKSFFLETGLDFTHFFTVDNPQSAYLLPFLGAGWQF